MTTITPIRKGLPWNAKGYKILRIHVLQKFLHRNVVEIAFRPSILTFQ